MALGPGHSAAGHAIWALPHFGSAGSLSLRFFFLDHDSWPPVRLFRSRRLNQIGGFLLGWCIKHSQGGPCSRTWPSTTAPKWRLGALPRRSLTPLQRRLRPLDSSSTDLWAVLRHPLSGLPGLLLPRHPSRAGPAAGDSARPPCAPGYPRQPSSGSSCLTRSVCSHSHPGRPSLGYGSAACMPSVGLCRDAVHRYLSMCTHLRRTLRMPSEGWSKMKGHLKGTSYLQMRCFVVRWFTADTAYHNIHHSRKAVPTTTSELPMLANARLRDVPTLRLGDTASRLRQIHASGRAASAWCRYRRRLHAIHEPASP